MKEMIEVIRKEERRRAVLLSEEDPDFVRDRWLFIEEPFVNEMCLMLLLALRHLLEREMVSLAARALDNKAEISREEYEQEIENLRIERKSKRIDQWDMKKIEKRLNLKVQKGYKSIEALRLLVNCYKHDPSMVPDRRLLDWLEIQTGIKYAPLPESDSLREGLAVFIGLSKDATYCDIAERFLDIATEFLLSIESRTELSEVRGGRVSLNPKDFLH
jgi:hypothetical protein